MPNGVDCKGLRCSCGVWISSVGTRRPMGDYVGIRRLALSLGSNSMKEGLGR